MPDTKILLVEDEAAQRRLVSGILQREGYAVSPTASVEEAIEQLNRIPFDLILSDWKLPGKSGYDLLTHVRQNHAEIAFIMVTAYGSIDRAVEAVRMGADDYLTKPYAREALFLAIQKACKARQLQHENQRLQEELGARDRLVGLVGKAEGMRKLYRRIEKIAATDATVLINGESGTGKELTARALHTLSKRSDQPFIAVNCAAIPEGLMESEFFGAERGAYTGADQSRIGRFEAADGGTLFLDELGELPMSIQPKLLRALQEGCFNRVGGSAETRVDVRVVAATNRDLAKEVAANRFREDLFYRLNVVPILLPPLRERREDIPMLIDHFREHHARKHGIHIRKLPSRIMKIMVDHSWPGNVRELNNVMERMILLSDDGLIQEEDLPPELSEITNAGPSGFKIPPGGMNWEAHEKDCLQQALTTAAGNRRRASKLLGLSYKAFLYRLEKHGL